MQGTRSPQVRVADWNQTGPLVPAYTASQPRTREHQVSYYTPILACTIREQKHLHLEKKAKLSPLTSHTESMENHEYCHLNLRNPKYSVMRARHISGTHIFPCVHLVQRCPHGICSLWLTDAGTKSSQYLETQYEQIVC
jgi:hypothetical protein